MPQRYLIVGPAWVGDMVMAQSLFRRLKSEQPDLHLAVLAPAWSEALLSRMPELGFDEILPVDGAFYIYASVSPFTDDALEFAGRMLEEAGVAATPGQDFDRVRGHRYMRFSFAGTAADMQEGIARLERWLR